MSEPVYRIRHSPGGFDSNDDPIPSVIARDKLVARGVAPGASSANARLGRDGESVEHSVYFTRHVDLTDDDKLEVRGRVYNIRVLDWRSAHTTRRGMVVLASLKRG